jgi:hypothetical protein
MRRTTIITTVTAGALVAAGIATATFKASGIAPATATFTTAGDNARTTTCVGGGSTYRITSGRFNGKLDFASPNDDLDGDFSLNVRAVYNTTTKLGWLEGTFRGKDRRPGGTVRGVLGESSGQVTMSGFAQGSVDRRYARLLGGVAATLKTDANGVVTSIDGTLGQGTIALPAVLAGTPCTGKSKPGSTPVKLSVKGTITALAADTITVTAGDAGPQTCAIVQGISPSTTEYALNQHVEMSCGIVNTRMTLLKLKRLK